MAGGNMRFNTTMSMNSIINQGVNQKRVNSMILAAAVVPPRNISNQMGVGIINRVHTAKPGCGACGK
jgi:hypothetical protein